MNENGCIKLFLTLPLIHCAIVALQTIGDDDVAEYQGNMKSGVYIAPEPIVYEPVMVSLLISFIEGKLWAHHIKLWVW